MSAVVPRENDRDWSSGTGNGPSRSGAPGPRAVVVAMARALLIVVLWAGLIAPAGARAAPPGASEYQVKAAFLFNFAQFIDWPARNRGPAGVNLCILGADPFGPAIDGMDGKRIDGFVMRVRRINRPADGALCDMLFIPNSQAGELSAILAAVRGRQVITIGETPGLAARGVTVNFYLEHDHVRFEINYDAAERTGLRFSSNLLRLARIVYDETGSGSSPEFP